MPFAARDLRFLLRGAVLGAACYAVLLTIHLAKFQCIEHAVPNIAGYAGRYPGYGYTWDLTLINLPADIFEWHPPDLQSMRTHSSWVIPQTIRFHREHPKVPRAWNPWTWVATGVLGYALAGALAGVVTWAGLMLRRTQRRRWAR